ncbi:sensor histidine kinase [Actinocorallia longicatena]|uniref:histidine kinase n=1 Tax=Actinocorallia longicatena TaxID=111803 RepID=A0ABP6QEB6_9ACTN
MKRAGYLVAAAALGAAGAAEAWSQADGSLTLALVLLAVAAAAVPAAFPGNWRMAVVATLAAVTLAAIYREPSWAGSLAVLVVWGPMIVEWFRRNRAGTAARLEEQRAFEASLLELTARGERARIARELHDVVAHHISMISVQADTARLAVPGMPADGVKHLLAIGETARSALTEMRRLLGVLREDAEPPPTRRPQPGLRDLLALIDETRQAGGGAARLIVSGPVTPLDPGLELTAYRVVQEALTNARRHAPGAAVDVELTYSPDHLKIRIRDNGLCPAPRHPAPIPPPPQPRTWPFTHGGPGWDKGQAGRYEGQARRDQDRAGRDEGQAGWHGSRAGRDEGGFGGDRGWGDGHGLMGMRERVATVGGSLWVGPGVPAGFLVEVVLPVGEVA